MQSAISFGFSPAPVSPPDDRSLVERIQNAYQRACNSYTGAGDSQWSLIEQWKAQAHDTLLKGSHEAATELLRSPADSNLFLGFDFLGDFTRKEISHKARQAGEAQRIVDAIINLAEVLGAIRFANPESHQQNDRETDPMRLLDMIAARRAIPVQFPNPFPLEFGLATRYGFVTLRAVYSLYQALRIQQVRSIVGGNRILEIGAGLGRTCYYAHQIGLPDYTIVDLPIVNAVQAYFLGILLGGDQIQLFGERSEGHPKIFINPSSELEARGSRYSVVLNADSLTEMDRKDAERYVAFVGTHAKAMISINHEANMFTT